MPPAANGTREPPAPGRSGLVWALGAALGLAFWVLDALGDAFVVRSSGFADALWRPSALEATMRGLVIGLLLSMAAVARWVVRELRRGEAESVRAVAREREMERLREIDRFKTDFINTAAHELNTPLTPIKVQLHLLKASNEMPPDGRGTRSVEILDRNFGRLSKLIQLVLDSARLQGGKLAMERRPVDLAVLVDEALETYRPVARDAGVALSARCERGLVAEGDPQWLLQVVGNFLSNAVKFSPAGGAVTVEALRRGREVVVRVRDSGPGLRPDQLARLFQPFSQVLDGPPKPGNGLGLYISKGIVDQHGGRIGVRSDGPGRGSSFWFALPLTAVAEAWRPSSPRGDGALSAVAAETAGAGASGA